MRQLGYDQYSIQLTGEMGCFNSATTESQFIGNGKAHIMSMFQRIFWPDATRIGVRPPGRSIYWRTLVERFCAFVENQTPEPLEIPKIPIIYCNDPFLRARKRLGSHDNLSKNASGVEGRSGSPPTSMEVIATRDAVEKV